MHIKQGAVFMLNCSSTIKQMLINPLKKYKDLEMFPGEDAEETSV